MPKVFFLLIFCLFVVAKKLCRRRGSTEASYHEIPSTLAFLRRLVDKRVLTVMANAIPHTGSMRATLCVDLKDYQLSYSGIYKKIVLWKTL